jgi:hypothetical protein
LNGLEPMMAGRLQLDRAPKNSCDFIENITPA